MNGAKTLDGWLSLLEEAGVSMESVPTLYQGERLKNLILCYSGPWAFLPYLRNREDEELHWHARQGVLLAFTEVVVALALVFLGLFPIFGYVSVRMLLPFWLLWCLGMSAASVLQGTKGKKHQIPILHQFVEYL